MLRNALFPSYPCDIKSERPFRFTPYIAAIQ